MNNENLKRLKSQVSECGDQTQAAELLVKGIADQLDGLTQDPVAIKALAGELRESSTELAKAIYEGQNKTPTERPVHFNDADTPPPQSQSQPHPQQGGRGKAR